MQAPPLPADEPTRLAVLQQFGLLDSAPEESTDRIVSMARMLSGWETALISLVDENRQWFKARSGLDATETPRDISFCGWTILAREPLLIPDALADDRFHDNPLVTGPPYIRAYAGFPVVAADGSALGTVCLLDPTPRTLPDAQIAEFRLLADMAMDMLVRSRANRELGATLARMHRVLELVPICSYCHSVRQDEAYGTKLDQWLASNLGAAVSHGICPDCLEIHHEEVASELIGDCLMERCAGCEGVCDPVVKVLVEARARRAGG